MPQQSFVRLSDFHFRLALLIALLLPFASSQRSTLLVGHVNQRDTNKPFYEVHFPRIGGFFSRKRKSILAPPATSIRMVTSHGQAMKCIVPQPAPIVEHAPTVTDPEAIFDDIDELFRQYENKCFMRHENWWTYEFCYGKHVIQKHIIPKNREPTQDEVEDEFVLGLFDREADKIRRKNASQVSTSDAAFTQLFTNGTVCDMTKKPRRVVVKYLCSEDVVQLGGISSRKAAGTGLNVINAIRETESCVYEVEFLNAAICQHATYRAKLARTSRHIHCSLERGERPFKGLVAASYHQSRLSL